MVRFSDLGSLQVEILKIVWAEGEATVNQLLAAWPTAKKPAYVTLLTVLRRLERRGFLVHGKRGHAFSYRAVIAETTAKQSMVADLSTRLFGSPTALIQSLLASGVATAAERQQMAALALA